MTIDCQNQDDLAKARKLRFLLNGSDVSSRVTYASEEEGVVLLLDVLPPLTEDPRELKFLRRDDQGTPMVHGYRGEVRIIPRN